jgi:hypothetical protein
MAHQTKQGGYMDQPQKIKRKDIPVIKNGLRADIDCIRSALLERVTKKLPIPRRVVDGSLSDVLKYKDAAQSVLSDYHINHYPSERASLKKLTEIKERLGGLQQVLCGE